MLKRLFGDVAIKLLVESGAAPHTKAGLTPIYAKA
jgi:hypothetical protein